MYKSSIINNYGDMSNVKSDAKKLNDIWLRQGSKLLIDVIAENAGNTANMFSLSESDRVMLIASLIEELRNALSERL